MRAAEAGDDTPFHDVSTPVSPTLIGAPALVGGTTLSEVRFPALGSEAHLVALDVPPRWHLAARAVVEDLERRWDPTDADSELWRLNLTGELRPASTLTYWLLEAAHNAYDVTEGRYDPAYLGSRHATWASVQLDPAEQSVVLFDDVTIDLDGIAAGFAADLVASEIIELGASAVIVNIAGNVRATARPDAFAWSVEVDDPNEPGRTLATIALGDGAVATSRTEHAPGIDVASVTVIASEAVWAAPLARAARAAGDRAAALLEDLGVAGFVVTAAGQHHETSTWKRYAR